MAPVVVPKSETKFYKNSLAENAKLIIIALKLLSLLPVSSLFLFNFRQFSFASWKSLLSETIIVGHISLFVIYCFVFVRSGVDMKWTAHVEYYFSAALMYILFLNLARKWHQLMAQWVELDYIFHKYCADVKVSKLKKAFISALILLTVGEQVLLIYHCYSMTVYFNKGTFALKLYFTILSNGIYQFLNKRIWLGVIEQVLLILSSFSMLFASIFISVIATLFSIYIEKFSFALKTEFMEKDLFQYKMEVNKELQIMNEQVWRQVRIDFNKICKLCSTVDGHICDITCLCVTHAILMILRYLLHIFRHMEPPMSNYSNYYSLICISFQLSLLLFALSDIYEGSKQMCELVHRVSNKHYNNEMKMLIWKVSMDKIAFTLSGYFTINRNTILNVFGTIITYELFVLQLKGSNVPDIGPGTNTSSSNLTN